ncbi:MAG TPA: tyrosine-type recombinase/integrase [Polyangia bacterium]|nr:tyrosine-type recombinase/integrase [Polyangia bacterium]
MPVRRNSRKKWIYRTVVKLRDGSKVRIFGTAERNTRESAEQAERDHIDRVRNPVAPPVEKRKVPTFAEWFWGANADAKEPSGRFWREWVIAEKNKPSEMEAKKSIYQHHLKSAFGNMPLDDIGVVSIAQFRAKLVEAKKSGKRINNILAVLSKALRYAVDAGEIATAPKVGLRKLERTEIEYWEFEEYARILSAARREGEEWYVAVCLAGEAGLRVGEIKALRWEHLDLVAGTLTVSEQTRHGITGTPKGGRRRVVPMTATLIAALRTLSVVRVGYVARNLDGSQLTDGQTTHAIRRIIRRAGLGERGWHSLRHSFGTHAALLGVNPWRLQAWMGHGRIDETMIYVHVASVHHRPLPDALRAVSGQDDPDRRLLYLMGRRASVTWSDAAVDATRDRRGTQVAPATEALMTPQ